MGSLVLSKPAYAGRTLGWQLLDACERLVAAVLLLGIAPLLAAAALAIAFLSRRSPFIAHRRVGWQGSTLWILKLRTMWDGRPRAAGASRWVEYIADDAGPRLKSAADARVTHGFARFCRRHSIDELPQLLHVVRGGMSLVGPRPLTQTELTRYYGAAAEEVLQAKPGLAGLWQVCGRNRLTYQERRRLDLALARNRSFRMYGWILLRTIPELWGGANTW